ncbi:MAG: hypothetical protein LH702_29255 [Phormidesmis sp. CAN_BIN44]|nr:hypothetical protein [Phormidesmis sp. CAN_BIN44]
MANPRIRLSPQTIDDVTELGQRCGIEDLDTVIKLLIRKYGDQLAELLSPVDPNRDTLTEILHQCQKPDFWQSGEPQSLDLSLWHLGFCSLLRLVQDVS